MMTEEGGCSPPPSSIGSVCFAAILGWIMLDRPLGIFVAILRAYYPPEEVIVNSGTIAVTGYLGRLVGHLMKRGYARKFVFVTYLIEYVDYREAIDRTEQFIEDLADTGIIYRDAAERDVYRVSKVGFNVFSKIEIRTG
jgi:hypothetical protein